MSDIAQISSRREFQTYYDRVYTTTSKKPALKSFVLLSEQSPENLDELLFENDRLKNYDVESTDLQDGLFKLQLKKVIRGRPAVGYALVDQQTDGFWIVYTDEGRYFVQTVLEPFLRGLYPDVARVYFNYLQIRKLLQDVERAYDGTAVVTYVAYKRQPLSGEGIAPGTRLAWEEGAENDLSKDLARYRIRLQSITFEVKNQTGMILLEASIGGRGLAQLKFGNFSAFRANVLQQLVQLATKWKKFFSNREKRIEDGKVRLSPYVFKYPFNFRAPQIEDLIAGLRKSYSHSILFGGNPYFVANLSDYQDGSSFYLTVLGDKITITPMLRATPYALWRIAGRIQRIVGEGQIVEAPRISGA